MTNLPFRLLFQVAALIGVLFLLSAKLTASEPNYRFKEETFESPQGNYDIVLYHHTMNYHKFTVYVRDRDAPTANIPEDLRFWVVLPDGNFIFLHRNNVINGVASPFRLEVYLQRLSGDPDFFIENTQAYLLKKNDPDPPLLVASTQIDVVYRDDTGNTEIDSGTFPTQKIIGLSDQYLGIDTFIKLDVSWNPWRHDDAYYYQIITFTQHKQLKSQRSSGEIQLVPCSPDQTGFEIAGYFTFDRGANPSEWKTVSMSGSEMTFKFTDLNFGEVRQIYVKMKRVQNETKLSAEYTLKIKYRFGEPIDSISMELPMCVTIPLSTYPHDPNNKQVDKTACTTNSTGKLTYLINFQNEGSGVAKNVIIRDKLPPELSPFIIESYSSSHNNLAILSPQTAMDPNIEFTFTGINLPGSTQTAPNTYEYLETTGWVQFTCAATCPDNGEVIANNAEIIFVGDQKVEDPIVTESITTTSDTTPRPDWENENYCNEKNCRCIFRCGRCRWYMCFYKKCKPKTQTGATKKNN